MAGLVPRHIEAVIARFTDSAVCYPANTDQPHYYTLNYFCNTRTLAHIAIYIYIASVKSEVILWVWMMVIAEP